MNAQPYRRPTKEERDLIQRAINFGNRFRRLFEKHRDSAKAAIDRGDWGAARPWLNACESTQKRLEDNRNLVIAMVDLAWNIIMPCNTPVRYDKRCGARGYTTGKCEIFICETPFSEGPSSVASTKIHEREHAQQKHDRLWGPGAGNPSVDMCTKLRHLLEKKAYQASEDAYDKCYTSDMPPDQKEWIKNRIRYHCRAYTKALIIDWFNKLKFSLPGYYVDLPFTLYNISDNTYWVRVTITDSLGWTIMPETLSILLLPDQECDSTVTVAIPWNARIGTVNSFRITAQAMADTSQSGFDLSAIRVIPTVEVTAGPDTNGLRGATVRLPFTIKNVGDRSDTFRMRATNPLGWNLIPSFFDVFLSPSMESTLHFNLQIPPNAPSWTTTLIFGTATSKTDTNQTHEDWLAVRVNEVDIMPTLIVSPSGIIPQGKLDTPKVYVYNSGHLKSFFDVFVEIDLPSPYRDSVKGRSAEPGELVPIEMVPLTLTSAGTFNVKFYTRATGDADSSNDTLRGTFQVIPGVAGWMKKNDVVGQPSGKMVKGGGGITATDDNLFLILGNNTRDFMKYDISGDLWSAACSIPTGERNKKVKKGAYIVDDGIYVYAFKGGGTNEFYKYDPSANSWSALNEPGFTKGLKGGFATYVNYGGNYIYAGSGSNNKEWKRFNIGTNTWEAAEPATLPVEKAKVGSGLTYDGTSKVYFLQGGGKKNYFYFADLSADVPVWTPLESLPLNTPGGRKKKVKEGGCIEYWNGKVYAVKGGNTKEFWSYDPTTNSWTYIGEVGGGAPAKGIKCGRTLTSTDDGIFCLIGNNTKEFWFYSPTGVFGKLLESGIAGEEVALIKRFSFKATNPTKGIVNIRYTLPQKEVATLRIYNVLGELVYSAKSDKGYFTIKNLPAGIYLLRFETKGYKEDRKLIVVK